MAAMGYFALQQVDLGRSVPYDTLKNAIDHAAKDMGWTARDEDNMATEYELGSVKKVQRSTGGKTITLKGLLRPKLRISANSGSNSSLTISNLFTFLPGAASEKKTEKFLNILSTYLPTE